MEEVAAMMFLILKIIPAAYGRELKGIPTTP
jgi:hypothetical protein